MEGIEMEQLMRNGLRDTAMTVRALNVDESDREATFRMANQIDAAADESDPEKLVTILLTTVMTGLMDQAVPMLVKMTVSRMLSEMNVKLIEGIQSSDTI